MSARDTFSGAKSYKHRNAMRITIVAHIALHNKRVTLISWILFYYISIQRMLSGW